MVYRYMMLWQNRDHQTKRHGLSYQAQPGDSSHPRPWFSAAWEANDTKSNNNEADYLMHNYQKPI